MPTPVASSPIFDRRRANLSDEKGVGDQVVDYLCVHAPGMFPVMSGVE